MYRNFFGLRSLPFEDRADTQFFYPTAECEESLAAMEYEIQYGSGMALLIGEAGTGKTLLLRTLLSRLQKTDQAVVITWSANGALDLLRECCKGFGVTLPSSQNQARLLSRLRRHLGRSAGAGNRSILIIDQAENLSSDNIAQLATLADLYGDRGKLLNIIVAAQPLVRSLLDRPEFARIRQHLFGERLLSPLTATETGDYIHHRLIVSGAGDADFFDHQAISLIHRLSGGIPRLVNRICNAAMLGAYSAQTKRITSIVVHETTSTSSATPTAGIARDTDPPTTEVRTPWSDAFQEPHSTGVEDNAETADFELAAATLDGLDTSETDSGTAIHGGSYETSGMNPATTDFGKETILLARLERAAAHAERMTSTTEASICRLTAVEKHLATLVEQAERVMESLAPSIQQEIETLDRTERRLLEIGARAERHTKDAEAGLVRVSSLASEADSSAGRVERACKAAADVESHLSAFAERLADQADQVHQRVATLMEGVESTEAAQSRLASLVSQADSMTQSAEESIAAIKSQARSAIDEVGQGLRLRADAEVDRCHRQLQTRITDYEESRKVTGEKIQGQLDTLLRRVSNAVSDAENTVERQRIVTRETGEAVANRVDSLLQKVSSNISDADEQAARLECAAKETVESARSKLDGVLRSVSTATVDAQRQVDALTVPLKNLLSEGERLERLLTVTLPRRCQEEHDAHLDRIRTTLSAELASVEQAADKALGAARSQLQGIVGQASSVVEDAGRSADFLRSKLISVKADGEGYVEQLMETLPARCCEEINYLTDAANSQLDGLREQLDEISNRRDETHSALAALECKTQASLEGLGSRAQAVIRPLVDAVQKGEQLQVTADRVAALQQQVANSLIDVGIGCERVSAARAQAGECERIVAAQADWRQGAEQLDAMISSARQIHEALLGLVAHADDKVGRMASHHSAASHILDRLYAENVAAHKVAERISNAANTVDDSVNKAQSQIDKIVALTESGQSLSDRISAENETAAARCEALDQSSAAAVQLIERHERLCADAENASERLVSGIGDARGILSTNQGLLEDFTAHADSIKTTLDELHAKASEIKNRVAESTAVPSAIVEEAHTQAAQLERVCGAVRKVFANLADSTLQAQRQTEGLREAERDAVVRLEELTAETQRSAQTLHEWVLEAVRTQSRLEQTLGECPSIRQTHPIETVQRLSRTAEPFARLGGQGISGELQVLHEPDEDEDIEPIEERATKPLTRTEEIARLINDAKQPEAAQV